MRENNQGKNCQQEISFAEILRNLISKTIKVKMRENILGH